MNHVHLVTMGTTAFHDLDDYLAIPRVTGLAASADGSRVVMTLAELDTGKTEFLTAVWELDPAGLAPARRLTRGAKGEAAPVFTVDNDLLFLASRPSEPTDTAPASLWRLPAGGGEAEQLLTLPGGVTAVRTAGAAARTLVGASLMPSATDIDDDKRLRELRKDAKVSALLHGTYPVRHWDHGLGPDEPHLLDVDGVRDVTPTPGSALREASFDISPDGTFVIASWRVPGPGASLRSVLVRIDINTGQRSVVADDPGADLDRPVISPDGTQVAFTRESISTPTEAPRITLCRMKFGSPVCQVAPQWDRWPVTVTWAADSSALIVVADERGRSPIFSIGLDDQVRRVTSDDFAYADVVATPTAIFALRSSYAAPPHPVRIDPDGTLTVIPSVALPDVPGALTEIDTTSADGTAVRSWLVVPPEPEPAPLLLWIHGGPLGSWNAWSWRWNPWLLAAQGYAVLLPDPALSTGYGQDFIQRGWGAWGGPTYEDLMAVTDAACADPRIDDTRTAAMGGSFGGYMANWVAGHTDRFSAIVTHAGLWALDQFGATTDSSYYWAREMTPEMAAQNSPHRFVDRISTPMLVIHGDKDYRVPIGEALRLWYELLAASGLPADDAGQSPHRFLYFPSENHWVLSPQHAKLWYQVVSAFLAEHVLGEHVALPETLG